MNFAYPDPLKADERSSVADTMEACDKYGV